MKTEILFQEFSNKKFVQDTISQICKDFSRWGWGLGSDLLNCTLVKTEIEELLAEKLLEIKRNVDLQKNNKLIIYHIMQNCAWENRYWNQINNQDEEFLKIIWGVQ